MKQQHWRETFEIAVCDEGRVACDRHPRSRSARCIERAHALGRTGRSCRTRSDLGTSARGLARQSIEWDWDGQLAGTSAEIYAPKHGLVFFYRHEPLIPMRATQRVFPVAPPSTVAQAAQGSPRPPKPASWPARSLRTPPWSRPASARTDLSAKLSPLDQVRRRLAKLRADDRRVILRELQASLGP